MSIIPSDEALPDHEGFTFNWSSSFGGSHQPESIGSDRFTENGFNIDDISLFCKDLGADKIWIAEPGLEVQIS